MTDKTIDINSNAYWDHRFQTDWIEKGGSDQTLFFGHIAIDNIPCWLAKEIEQNRLSIGDWGCALGEATNLLRVRFPESKVTGIDLSDQAIEQAKRKYPLVEFTTADLLTQPQEFDVIFSSNTLEHFRNPAAALEMLVPSARCYLWLLLPFYDNSGIDEHFVQFTYANLPISVGGRFVLVYEKKLDTSVLENTEWHGEQIMLVYARRDLIENKSIESIIAGQPSAGTFLVQGVAQAAEQLSNLYHRVGHLTREYDVISRQYQVLEEEKSAFEVLKRKFSEKEKYYLEYRERCEQEIQQFRDEVQRREQEIQQLKEESSKQLKELQENFNRERDLNDAKFLAEVTAKQTYLRKLGEVYKSLSWRWTFPLRYVLHLNTTVLRRKRWEKYRDGSEFFKTEIRETYSSTTQIEPVKGDISHSALNDIVADGRKNTLGVIVFTPIVEWNITLFQRPQHLATSLARNGYTVIYFTPNDQHDHIERIEEIEKGLFLVPNDKYWEDFFSIRNVLILIYSTGWYFRSEWIRSLREQNNIIVYDYIDHIDERISGEHVKSLLRLFNYVGSDTVDYVFASGRILVEEMEHKMGKEKVLYVPNGVDLEHYDAAKVKFANYVPEDIAPVIESGKPVIGYFGAIAPWLWYDLIAYCVQRRPQYNFIFIGPNYYGGSDKLSKGPNFFYLGPKDYKILPAYAKHFSVGIIPFEPGEIARTTSPLKLFEYFALEKPVVVTSDMSECTAIKEVLHANDFEGFATKLDEAVALTADHAFLQKLQKHAEENTWDKRAGSIKSKIGAIYQLASTKN